MSNGTRIARNAGNSVRNQKSLFVLVSSSFVRALGHSAGTHTGEHLQSGEHGSISGGNHQSNVALTFCFASPLLLSQSSFVLALLSSFLCFKSPSLFIRISGRSSTRLPWRGSRRPSLSRLHFLVLPSLAVGTEWLRLRRCFW